MNLRENLHGYRICRFFSKTADWDLGLRKDWWDIEKENIANDNNYGMDQVHVGVFLSNTPSKLGPD